MSPHFEPFDIPARRIFVVALVLVFIILVIFCALTLWEAAMTAEQIPTPRLPATTNDSQVDFESGLLLRAYLQSQNEILKDYSFEEGQDYGRIPVDQAFHFIVQKASYDPFGEDGGRQ